MYCLPTPRASPRFPHGWLKCSVHLDTSTMIGWIVGDGAHRKPSARKATHSSTLPGLGGLFSEFHGIKVKAFGLSHSFLTWLIDTNGVKKKNIVKHPYHVGMKMVKSLL